MGWFRKSDREAAPAGITQWTPSVTVRPADTRFNRKELDAHLQALGNDGALARKIDELTEARMARIRALSPLTGALAVDYLERLGRPIPALTPEIGARIVARSYLAHMVVESDALALGLDDIPVLGTLPKKGSQQLLNIVVKASRRNFDAICALSPAAWDGLVHCILKRAHDQVAGDDGYIAGDVVEGLCRFGWVLRQADLFYKLEPEAA